MGTNHIVSTHYPLPPVLHAPWGDYIPAHQRNLSHPDPNPIVPFPRSRDLTTSVVAISRNFCIRERHENWDCGQVRRVFFLFGVESEVASQPLCSIFSMLGLAGFPARPLQVCCLN